MSKPQRGLLFDAVQCQGCRECIAACKKTHDFPGEAEDATVLSATTYTTMVELQDYPIRNLCRHCLEPSCASVCPVRALEKTDIGPITYDASRCMGCRYCMMACPFNIPRYEWNEPVPAVRKCDMCIDRLREGKPTACTEACSFGATLCGTRDELLAEARRRIKEAPDEYYDHIYGETELGGTSVLFLTPFPIEELGYKESFGTEPLPTLTWEVLSKVPAIGVVGGASMLAFWWITRRRNEVALAEAARNSREKDNGHV